MTHIPNRKSRGSEASALCVARVRSIPATHRSPPSWLASDSRRRYEAKGKGSDSHVEAHLKALPYEVSPYVAADDAELPEREPCFVLCVLPEPLKALDGLLLTFFGSALVKLLPLSVDPAKPPAQTVLSLICHRLAHLLPWSGCLCCHCQAVVAAKRLSPGQPVDCRFRCFRITISDAPTKALAVADPQMTMPFISRKQRNHR